MGMDVKAISQRRSELESRMQGLLSKKAVLESQIGVLCQQLGLAEVPSIEELDKMIMAQQEKVVQLGARARELEGAVSAWEAHYKEVCESNGSVGY